MDRFEVRPQRHNAAFPYDAGHAVYDTAEARQCGWYMEKARAEARVAERNGAPAPLPPLPTQPAQPPASRVKPLFGAPAPTQAPAKAPAPRGARPLVRQLAASGLTLDAVRAELAKRGMALAEGALRGNYKAGQRAGRQASS